MRKTAIIVIFASLLLYCVNALNTFKSQFRVKILRSSIQESVDQEETSTLLNGKLIDTFFQDVRSRACVSDDGSTVVHLKKMGYDLVQSMKMPKIKDEAWRFTNVNKLFGSFPTGDHWLPSSLPISKIKSYFESTSDVLVFIDGKFHQELSLQDIDRMHPSVAVKFLTSTALDQLPSVTLKELQFVPQRNVPPRESFGSDLLTGINAACMEDVLMIQVADRSCIARPIQLLYFTTASASESKLKAIFPKILIELGENSELAVKESYITLSDDTVENEASNFICSNLRAIVKANAVFKHTVVEGLSQKTRHTSVISADVHEESRYDLRLLQIGAAQSRINVHVNLTERLANCSIYGATLSGHNQVLDVHSSIIHTAPETYSDQKHNILLGEAGRAVFKGHIRIPSEGQKSEANQQCRSIMLGDQGRVQIMPTLEITANDVSCSHGAAIADVDPNALFFLATRGIDYQTARKILTKSFILSLFNDAVMGEEEKLSISQRILELSPKTIGNTKSAQQQLSL